MLERQTGAPTYFAADVAYQEDKFLRGFDRAIYVLGADHHGYVARLKAIASSLGEDPDAGRDPDPAVRAHRRGRRPGEDVQAPGRLRDAGRADRADRRRRHALVHAQPLARLDDRPRRRARGQAGPGEPRLLRADDARADRRDLPAAPGRPGRRGARRRARPCRRSTRPSATSSARCCRSRTSCTRPRSGARRTGSPATPSSSARRSPSFYRDSTVRDEPDEALQSFRIGAVRGDADDTRRRARPARRVGPGVDVITVPARLPAPYVHADNRGLVLCNGPQCIYIQASQLRAVRRDVRDHRRRGPRDPRAGSARRRRLRIGVRRCALRRNPGSSAVRDRHRPPTSPRCARRSRLPADESPARRARPAARRGRARRRRGEAPDAVLAADRLRSRTCTSRRPSSSRPDGKQAPAEPGYVLGFQEMSLVDSKDPDAKPLPVAKMMVHHFLYFTAGRAERQTGGCLGGDFLGRPRRGASERALRPSTPPDIRARYGIHNATPQGNAPAWTLTAMVMNHYQRSKRFYVRTRIWYTTEPRTPIYPTAVGDCRHLLNGMAYDVPGGGLPGSRSRTARRWTAPFSGRIIGAASHHHGGAINHTLSEPDVRPRAVQRQGVLRRRRSPVQHDPPDPARARPDRQRHVPARRGSRWPRARCSSASRCTTTRRCTSPRWASGCCCWPATTRSRGARRCRATSRGHRAREVRHRGAVRVQPHGAAAVQAERAAGGRSTAASATSSSAPAA